MSFGSAASPAPPCAKTTPSISAPMTESGSRGSESPAQSSFAGLAPVTNVQSSPKTSGAAGTRRTSAFGDKQSPVSRFMLPPPRAPEQGPTSRPNPRRPKMTKPGVPGRSPVRGSAPLSAPNVGRAGEGGFRRPQSTGSLEQMATKALGGESSLEPTAMEKGGQSAGKSPINPFFDGVTTAAPSEAKVGRDNPFFTPPSTIKEVQVSGAVSEDLAYMHRGSSLESYAITGTVLLSASGVPTCLRVTDEHGHIAASNPNPRFVESTSNGVPTREYVCKAVPAPNSPADPKFFPAVMYRCSPAVKNIPARVNCQLRLSDVAVLVWVQVIANPQLSKPLSGVSVLVNLPFALKQEQVS